MVYTNMRMNKHITNTITKANRKIDLRKALICKQYGCDIGTQVIYVFFIQMELEMSD